MINATDFNNKVSLENKTSRNLTKLYIAALTAVACLTITGQVLVQRSISNQLADSHVINMAGKQRYMSQQLCKVVLLIYGDIDHIHYRSKVNALENMVRDWTINHHRLVNANIDKSYSTHNSEEVETMFKKLQPYFITILSSINKIIEKAKSGKIQKSAIGAEVNDILKSEKVFLVIMDKIVHQYDTEAKAKVIFLRNIELFLLVVTLLILLLEGYFVFKPAASTINKTIKEIVGAENKATGLAGKLLESNDSLKKSLKELEDVNYALNTSSIVAKTDRYGHITFVNAKFCEISGYAEEELLGNKFDLISGYYHSKTFFDKLWQTISEGNIWNNEIKNKAKDGRPFWLDATIVPVLDEAGVPQQYIAIYTDITLRFRQSINEQKIRSASIIEGQEKERRKTARELHDGLGQMLTALKFNIEGLKGAPTKKEKQHLEEIRHFMLETIKEVRRISFNLMPSVLSDFGIIPAFKHLCEQVAKHAHIEIKFENESQIQRLHKTVEINLYRIVQEALNNAVKYAQANQVTIHLENNDSKLKLQITDNGVGFNSKTLDRKDLINSGNGISNIQERTSLIDGEFKMETAPGQGTKIRIEVPLNTTA